MNKSLDKKANALHLQKHQLNSAQITVGNISRAINTIESEKQTNQELMDQMFVAFQLQTLESQFEFVVEDEDEDEGFVDSEFYIDSSDAIAKIEKIEILDEVGCIDDLDWNQYIEKLESYAARNNLIQGGDPFKKLMSVSERIELEKRIKDDFSFKNAQCDKYDYMIAGTCGLIGGLIDVFFVGIPGQGALTKFTDDVTDGVVQKFAQLNGWNKDKAEERGSNITASAIGFLEGKFKINYDQATTNGNNGTNGKVKNLSMKNHHIKSLGHSPDLVGLFFSILDQFNNTSHFVSDGKLISIDTENFELTGNSFAAKIFAGFFNWLGHLFSDVAGSSGTRGSPDAMGTGIPIPFYSLLQFINVGEFGKDRQSFAVVAVKVFEQGYDLRHGMALAIPVLVSELLTRLMWFIKQHFYHEKPLSECLPSANNPELRRMLLVVHGSLCLVDTTDAALRSGGNMIQFMLRSNVIAWVRFGNLALKELKACYDEGGLDTDAVDDYLDREYERMISN